MSIPFPQSTTCRFVKCQVTTIFDLLLIIDALNWEAFFIFCFHHFEKLAYGSKEAITSQEEGKSSALIDDVSDNLQERFRGVEVMEILTRL